MSDRIDRPVLVGRLPEAKLKAATGQVLQAIADYWAMHNISPSFRDIATATGKSLTATGYQVRRLLELGCLERPVKSTTRSLRVTSEGWRQLKRGLGELIPVRPADRVENHCEAAVLGTKKERVLAWAQTMVGTPVRVRSDAWRTMDKLPGRDQVVLGLVYHTRTVHLLKHKGAGVYDVLRPGDVWFDEPPERAVQVMDPPPDGWRAIPEEVLNG